MKIVDWFILHILRRNCLNCSKKKYHPHDVFNKGKHIISFSHESFWVCDNACSEQGPEEITNTTYCKLWEGKLPEVKHELRILEKSLEEAIHYNKLAEKIFLPKLKRLKWSLWK